MVQINIVFVEIIWRVLKKFKMILTYNPALSLLGVHLENFVPTIKVFAPSCLLMLSSQKQITETNVAAYQQMNG